jgi:hypothetical protein
MDARLEELREEIQAVPEAVLDALTAVAPADPFAGMPPVPPVPPPPDAGGPPPGLPDAPPPPPGLPDAPGPLLPSTPLAFDPSALLAEAATLAARQGTPAFTDPVPLPEVAPSGPPADLPELPATPGPAAAAAFADLPAPPPAPAPDPLAELPGATARGDGEPPDAGDPAGPAFGAGDVLTRIAEGVERLVGLLEEMAAGQDEVAAETGGSLSAAPTWRFEQEQDPYTAASPSVDLFNLFRPGKEQDAAARPRAERPKRQARREDS